MDKWRNPLKWVEITNFALVVLSAVGMQHLLASLEADAPGARILRSRLAWLTMGVLILLALGLAASYPLAILLIVMLQKEGCDPLAVSNMMSTMHASLLVALVVMALFCLVLRVLWRPEPLRGVTLVNPLLHYFWHRMLEPAFLPLTLALSLAGVAVAQLGWVTNQFIQSAPLATLTATNPLLEALRSEGDTVRVGMAPGDPMLNDLMQNQFYAMRISCLDISAASRIPDDLNTFFEELQNNQARLWFLAGVKNVVVPQQALQEMQQDPGVAANIAHADGYTLEQTDTPNLPTHALVGMKDYLAKATLVPHAEYFATDEALLKRLKDPDWNPRASVLLHPEDKPPPSAGPAGSAGAPDEVELKTYTPTEIEIEAYSAQGGYVLIDDQYDSDWQAQVNGRDVPLLRADYILRAVQIPAGASTITLHYATRYRVGDMILQMTHRDVGEINFSAEVVNTFSDGALLAAWLLAGFALLRRRGREAVASPDDEALKTAQIH
jgi:hypothetical protein